MIPELYIENQKADITTTMSSLLTFAIDDIKDFAARSTAFSKTIILPGSLNNNILFGNIFEVAISNSYDPDLPNVNINFNAGVLANCIYFQDFIQVFKGTIRILQINIDRGRIDYEVAISGEITKLNSLLATALLEDLDFSAYNETYNATNIVTSWDNPGGSGVYYPLIDYGTYSTNKHDWQYGTFRPALYVKEYIDKIFAAANFRYTSALFDTDRFKSLIIPHNRKQLTKKSNFILNRTSPTTTFDGDLDPDGPLVFSGDVLTIDFTTADNIEFEYTGAGFTGEISVRFVGEYTGGTGSATFNLFLNSVIVASTTANGVFDKTLTYTASLATSDVISVGYSILPHRELTVHGNLKVGSDVPVDAPVTLGDTIDMNETLPKNIKQIDFLLSIVTLFNLYVYEDRFDERLLHITPYVDFYSEESQNAVNWTYKLDRNSPVKIQPLSEINAKVYNFKYASDTDYYNDLYKKRYNETYGSYTFDTEFDFVNNTENVELIFAGTPLVGYVGEEKVYPTIFKLSGTTEETTDSVIRIMQTKKITGVTTWDLLDDASVLNSLDYYGYAGHFDDPDNVTNDLNFGVPDELFFILVTADLTATQFNVYWSAYMAEITDKDSKLFTGKFYLTPKDILELDFSKYVNVDGNLFRLNKIQDYNLTKPDLAPCELLKVINTLY